MTTTVAITGSGNPGPSADRAGPGVLVRHGGIRLQFDAGRATVMRLAALDVRPPDLDALFITHHHSDHLTGLADVVLTRWILDGRAVAGPLQVVVPAGPAARFVERLLDGWREDIEVRRAGDGRPPPSLDLDAFEVPPRPGDMEPGRSVRCSGAGDTSDPGGELVDVGSVGAGDASDPDRGLVEAWFGGDVRVLAGEMRHDPVRPAVGYRVETPDGVVAITGDTRVCAEVAALAAGADVLVYEAMRFEAVLAHPYLPDHIREYHADTRLIGAQAAELGVGSLVLTHLIPEPTTPAEVDAFRADVRAAGFGGQLIVADDLDTVTLG